MSDSGPPAVSYEQSNILPKTTHMATQHFVWAKSGVDINIMMRITSDQWAMWAKEIRLDLREMRQWLLRNEDMQSPFMLIFLCLGSHH